MNAPEPSPLVVFGKVALTALAIYFLADGLSGSGAFDTIRAAFGAILLLLLAGELIRAIRNSDR